MDACSKNSSSKQVCRVLYVFSGKPRKNSVSSWLHKLSKQFGVAVEVEMVDIQVRPFLDLTKQSVQQRLLNKIATGHFFAVLFSPPCSTFTRVVWANKRGPRPIRSYRAPRGFSRLTWAERKRADWGNSMTDFTFEGFEQQAKQGGMAIFENPEDLGAVKNGENFGVRPASMWQWDDFYNLLELESVQTAAFYQQDFGTEYLKPTRLLLANVDAPHKSFVMGKPTFDDQGFYTGPLQTRKANRQLVGTSGIGFATTGTEQWPPNFCKWIATQILEQFAKIAPKGPVLAEVGETPHSDRTEYPVSKPDGAKSAGGVGPPRQCQQPGKERQFHDGAGLPSMGRWDVEHRIWSDTPFWKELREETLKLVIRHLGDERRLDRACFEMAVKGEQGCDIVRDEALKNNIRALWISKLKQHGSTQENLDFKAPGQPFFLRLLKELLAFSGDVDREFLLQGESGFPVGVDLPLPRTPHVFEEQTNWKLEDDPYMREEVWRSNYHSVAAHKDFVRQQFDEECAEGLMEKLTLQEAKQKYGDRIAISSLAVLVEENHQGKRRVIHDATHGTKVNNRIKCRDKVRSPSAREKQYLLAYFQQRRASVFSLVGDISKTHRRFLHAPEERGLLACRIDEEDDYIYVNRVGTFGLACASYWWSRIAGSGIRLIHELLGPQMPIELLIFADDVEAIAASPGGRRGITLSFLFLSCLGFPFKWSKQRGGLRVECIGLYTDYTCYKIGLSPRRAEWLHDWVMKLAKDGSVYPKALEQGLGRLGFAALALHWEKPFLGPIYSWSAAVRNKKGKMKMPAMLRAILLFLGKRFKEGGQMQEAPPLTGDADKEESLLFFTDARATETDAWIGGYKQDRDGKILSWFSEEVTADWANWLTLRKDPKRLIASLELLATLVATKLWMPENTRGTNAKCWIRGKTDNLGNSYAVAKWMSTKFPLTVLVMELSESLRLCNCYLNLDWLRRDDNQLADDLSNMKFDNFNLEQRVRWFPFEQKWHVLTDFLEHAKEFHEEIKKRKSEEQPMGETSKKKARSKGLGPW